MILKCVFLSYYTKYVCSCNLSFISFGYKHIHWFYAIFQETVKETQPKLENKNKKKDDKSKNKKEKNSEKKKKKKTKEEHFDEKYNKKIKELDDKFKKEAEFPKLNF